MTVILISTIPAEVIPAKVIPAKVITDEIITDEIIPAEIIPAEVIPAEVTPAASVMVSGFDLAEYLAYQQSYSCCTPMGRFKEDQEIGWMERLVMLSTLLVTVGSEAGTVNEYSAGSMVPEVPESKRSVQES